MVVRMFAFCGIPTGTRFVTIKVVLYPRGILMTSAICHTEIVSAMVSTQYPWSYVYSGVFIRLSTDNPFPILQSMYDIVGTSYSAGVYPFMTVIQENFVGITPYYWVLMIIRYWPGVRSEGYMPFVITLLLASIEVNLE